MHLSFGIAREEPQRCVIFRAPQGTQLMTFRGTFGTSRTQEVLITRPRT